jgi:hypothetical protein
VGVAFSEGPKLLPFYENLAKWQLLPLYAHILSVTFTVLPLTHSFSKRGSPQSSQVRFPQESAVKAARTAVEDGGGGEGGGGGGEGGGGARAEAAAARAAGARVAAARAGAAASRAEAAAAAARVVGGERAAGARAEAEAARAAAVASANL